MAGAGHARAAAIAALCVVAASSMILYLSQSAMDCPETPARTIQPLTTRMVVEPSPAAAPPAAAQAPTSGLRGKEVAGLSTEEEQFLLVWRAITRAMRLVVNVREVKAMEQTLCNKKTTDRPGQHTPDLYGNACEPWLSRPAVMLLSHVLDPTFMKGLEFGMGSSTMWLLPRLYSLASIDHYASFAQYVRTKLVATLPRRMQDQWRGTAIKGPTVSAASPAKSQLFLDYDNRDMVTYCRGEGFLSDSEAHSFDFVFVDGRARVGCMWYGARHWLKKSGGILALDNSGRHVYRVMYDKILPSHWVRVDIPAKNDPQAMFSLWISCAKDSPQCAPAQAAVKALQHELGLESNVDQYYRPNDKKWTWKDDPSTWERTHNVDPITW